MKTFLQKMTSSTQCYALPNIIVTTNKIKQNESVSHWEGIKIISEPRVIFEHIIFGRMATSPLLGLFYYSRGEK